MKLRVAFFLILVCLSVILFSCRRNQPSLVDANRSPDTELWYAPPDSTEYDWNVHLYWRGIDMDGTATQYIWTITDTLEANLDLRWSPAERVVDYRAGRITSRTDTVIAFEAFKNVAGVGLRKNRQAFHIAAIDDNGVIDSTPAAVEFVATVGELPRVVFATTITNIDPYDPGAPPLTSAYDPAVLDTVGMFRPFSLSYRGITSNGLILAYKYYPLTATVNVDGQDLWSDDLADTIRYFPNVGDDAVPSGVFRFVTQCKDESSAESRADVKSFTDGVVQLVVNYQPDTEINQLENTYFVASQEIREFIDIDAGSPPDTVPYKSWLRLDYRGWDDRRDSTLCVDDVNKCIGYQLQYERDSARIPGASSRSRWLPDTPEDNNPDGTPDSTTMNMGSVEYVIRARSVDEYGKADGNMFETNPGPEFGLPKSEIEIVGNFNPTLDDSYLMNYDGVVAPTAADTFVWDWWNPSNTDTVEIDFSTGKVNAKKIYYFDINATGHDHPKENVNFGVVNWYYLFTRTLDGVNQKFGRSKAWVEGPSPNVLADRYEVIYRYDLAADPGGANIWANQPAFWNKEYEFDIYGRDIGREEFEQYMFVAGEKEKLNSYQASQLGRWTEHKTLRFYLKVTR